MTFGKKVIEFYKELSPPAAMPPDVDTLFPYTDPQVMDIVSQFHSTYFNDHQPRTFLIGINPGRLGGGLTGIPFTDPINLENRLGISNSFDKKHELSSRFIYHMIDSMGGPKFFYQHFYFTSVSPVGFVKHGKNLNYYDVPDLAEQLENYMVDSLRQQVAFGARPVAYSLGQGKNIKALEDLNNRYHLFEEITPLPHPRWVMQYRLKRLDDYIQEYKNKLTRALE